MFSICRRKICCQSADNFSSVCALELMKSVWNKIKAWWLKRRIHARRWSRIQLTLSRFSIGQQRATRLATSKPYNSKIDILLCGSWRGFKLTSSFRCKYFPSSQKGSQRPMEVLAASLASDLHDPMQESLPASEIMALCIHLEPGQRLGTNPSTAARTQLQANILGGLTRSNPPRSMTTEDYSETGRLRT